MCSAKKDSTEVASGPPQEASHSGVDHRAETEISHPHIAIDTTPIARRDIFRLLFDDNPSAVVLGTLTGQFIRVNEAFAKLLGYTRDELFGQHVETFTVPEDMKQTREAWHVIQTELDAGREPTAQVIEKRYVRVDGRVVTCRAHLRAVQSESGEHIYLAMIDDQTDQKEVERRLRYEAFHDRMTGLPNRALFLDRLGQALLRDDAGHVVVIGLDRLRSINEAFGHSVGDRVVVSVARRLAATVSRGDTVARIGGDEFAVLLSADSSESTISAIHLAARPSLQPDGRELVLTASVGIRALKGLEAPELVLGDALLALQRAKELGRNRAVHYEPGLRGKASRMAEIARNLRDAVFRKEIDIDFQPIHRTDDGRLTGFEALARWRRSTLGAVSPAEFVPVAEERGLILPIGAYVLGESLDQLARWRKRGGAVDALTMSVNLSPMQARDSAHMELLRQIILGSDVPPSRVKVEITESVFVDMTSDVVESLDALRRAGVQLVLDDFGTGYSSLNHLQALPFDGLKVDRSFVVRAVDDARSRNLVRSIASLARGLDMHSTAEGVELPEQRAFLTEFGFDYLQGYLFGRPMDADAVELLVQKLEGEER